jgi:nitroreductase
VHTLEVIRARGSTRAFLPRPVAPELILQIIAAANYAPSGSNIQPWHVHVVSGATRDALCARVAAAAGSGPEPSMAYKYYPTEWREPYLSRRRACGWGLYGTLGIRKTDREAMQAQQLRNFLLFDAPVGLYFTIDRDLNQGSWLDYGMYIQTVMLAATSLGLATCPQASWLAYDPIVREVLSLADEEALVCGVALGYADLAAPVNRFRPARIGAADVVTWHGSKAGGA